MISKRTRWKQRKRGDRYEETPKKRSAAGLVPCSRRGLAFHGPARNGRRRGVGGATQLEQSDYCVAGTNSVGRLLAGALEEPAGEEQQGGETGLSAITVTGRTAQVSLHTAVGGTLLAAVYDEETQVMLASGRSPVSAGDQTAQVEFDLETLPDYFIVRAFLLDEDLASPLRRLRVRGIYQGLRRLYG